MHSLEPQQDAQAQSIDIIKVTPDKHNYVVNLVFLCKTYTVGINSCPAEPEYALPLRTVQIQISWLLLCKSQLIWICTVCQ